MVVKFGKYEMVVDLCVQLCGVIEVIENDVLFCGVENIECNVVVDLFVDEEDQVVMVQVQEDWDVFCECLFCEDFVLGFDEMCVIFDVMCELNCEFMVCSIWWFYVMVVECWLVVFIMVVGVLVV